MKRHVAPEFNPIVPEAAAPLPAKASFAGSWLFNLIAFTCVAGISAFGVLTPFGDSSKELLSAAVDQLPGGSADAAAPVTATTDEATTSTTTTTTAATTTTSSTPPDASTTTQITSASAGVKLAHVPPTTTKVTVPTSAAPTTAAPTTTARVLRCTDFATQPEAQVEYDQDPAAHVGWDGDGDGAACENLPGRPAPSTTTTVRLPRCSDFATQAEAQADFDADPAAHVGWDGDGDGLACEDLLGGRPLPSVNDVIKPPSERYYGVYTRQAPGFMGEVDSLASTVGKTPNMLMFFDTLSDPYPRADVDTAWSRGMVPMVTLEPLLPSGNVQPTLDDLMSPQWDAYATQWATDAKAHGKPVVVRFAHEMNGDWYPWGERTAGNEPGDYVQVWRHLHDIFASVGATNVVWYWSVNRIDQLPAAGKNVNSLYPGDDYVDWIGMSGYCRTAASGQPATCDGTFDTTFKATLDALQAMPSKHVYKPVVIGETGAAVGDPQRTQWTQNLFVGLKARPEVIGFVWFNDTKPNTGNDWRIEYSTEQSAAFAAGVADPRYGSGLPPASATSGTTSTSSTAPTAMHP